MKSFWWWLFSPLHWRLWGQRNRRREQLALLLFKQLSAIDRAADSIEPSWRVVAVVKAVESGLIPTQAAALTLWQSAQSDTLVQNSAEHLRVLCSGHKPDNFEPLSARYMYRLRRDATRGIEFGTVSLMAHLPVLLPLLSALFLFSGYVYITLLFRPFDISVNRYFGLSDYISASMEGLVPTLAACLFSLVTFYFTRRLLRLSAMQKLLHVQILVQLTVPVLLVAVVIYMRHISPDNANLLTIYTLSIGIGTFIVPHLAAYSSRPYLNLLLGTFVVLYAAIIWLLAEKRVQVALSNKPAYTEIIFTEQAEQPKRWRIVSGNTLYLFLLNDAKELVAVPIEQIRSIRHLKKPTEDK